MIDDLLGKLIADKYRVEGLISEHESGDLYFGIHEIQGRRVTLRVLSPALAIDGRWAKAFLNEARAASLVSHPNAATVMDFGTDARGITYTVYDEIKGRPLSEILTSVTPMDEKRALAVAVQVAGAVADAHEKQVVHGRLEPRSIYVDAGEDEADAVTVFGFGSDRLQVPRGADPRYLAPEQCTAFPAADERTDVFALGVILYQALSGVVPFDAATAAEALSKQNNEPPAPLSAFRRDLHPDIEPIVLTAIAADPDRRYQGARAFAEDLDLLRKTVEGEHKAVTLGSPVGKKAWQTAVVVLAGISILAAALIYATSVRQTDPTTQLQAADQGSLPVQPIGPATGAQEESLARMPALTDAEIMSTAAMQQMQSDLPGGDGYNAWANGGVPPPGAPLNSQGPPLGYVPPGGQMYTVDPNAGSQFMPNLGGVELRCMDPATRQEIPCPNAAAPVEKAPEKPAAGQAANTSASPQPAVTPKPLATPPPKTEKPAVKPTPDKPEPGAGSSKSDQDNGSSGSNR